MTSDYATARRALVAANLVKTAFDTSALEGLATDPHVRRALLGAGVGAGAGALRSLVTPGRRKRILSDALTGGLLGGAVGGGGSLIAGALAGGKSPPSVDQTALADASERATDSRQSLGLIGVPPAEADRIADSLATGQSTPDDARADLRKVQPGVGEQLASVPAATLDAARQGSVGKALEQADVLGVKNLIPGSGSFAASAAVPAVGANLLARGLVSPSSAPLDATAKRLISQHGSISKARSEVPLRHGVTVDDIAGGTSAAKALTPAQLDDVRKAFKTHGVGGRGLLSRITGGKIPALAGLAPLVAREWLSPDGYRSGSPDLFALAQAHRDARGPQ